MLPCAINSYELARLGGLRCSSLEHWFNLKAMGLGLWWRPRSIRGFFIVEEKISTKHNSSLNEMLMQLTYGTPDAIKSRLNLRGGEKLSIMITCSLWLTTCIRVYEIIIPTTLSGGALVIAAAPCLNATVTERLYCQRLQNVCIWVQLPSVAVITLALFYSGRI